MKNILIFERALFIYLGATVLTSVLSDNPFQSLSKISEVFSYVVLYFFLSRKFFVSESRIYKTLFCIGFLFALGYSSTLLLHTFYLMPKLPSWLSFLHAGKIEMDQPFIIRWIQGLHYYGFIRDGRIKFINGAVSCSLNSAILFFIFFGMSAFYKKYKTYSKKWFFIWGYILIFALAVFFSYSRATLFAFIVFGMTVGFYYLPRKSKYVFSIICFLFVCGMFFNKFLFTKMTQETYKSFSKRHKLPAWKKTLHYIIHESSPKILIFGAGPEQSPVRHSENQYLHEFVEKGIVGLASYLFLILAMFLVGYRMLYLRGVSLLGKSMGWALMSSILVFSFHVIFSVQFRSSVPYFLMMMVAVLSAETKVGVLK